MENQFDECLHEFYMEQSEDVRSGILEYYRTSPPDNMYLFWNASCDARLSERARKAATELDVFFLQNKTTYISFELAHRRAQTFFSERISYTK